MAVADATLDFGLVGLESRCHWSLDKTNRKEREGKPEGKVQQHCQVQPPASDSITTARARAGREPLCAHINGLDPFVHFLRHVNCLVRARGIGSNARDCVE